MTRGHVDSKLSLREPFREIGILSISNQLQRGIDGQRGYWIIPLLICPMSPDSLAQDNSAPIQSSSRVVENGQDLVVAKGEFVTELDDAIWHVFQAKNNDYWFGSRDQGVYRYDGKNLVQFTTKDGLCDNDLGLGSIQEDALGNIYFNTAKGVSIFDGESFVTLEVASPRNSAKSEWKIQQDDLWFQGAQNAGVIYRYDGKLLHQLTFPRTKDGDEHYRQMPRDKFPNANFSPYDVYSIFKDSQGNIWFGTSTLGVCRFDGKSFSWLPESELKNGSFGTRSIIEDKQGRFWFCHTLYRYYVEISNSTGAKFNRVDGLRSTDNPYRELIRGIMSCTLDSDDALWMATYQDGVWQYDGESVKHYQVKDGDEAVNTFSIYRDRQGVLWLGTQQAGAYKFNGKAFEKFKP